MGDYCLIKVHCWRKQQYYNESFMKQLFMSLELYFEDYFKKLDTIDMVLHQHDESSLYFNANGDMGRKDENVIINKIVSMAGDLSKYSTFKINFINVDDAIVYSFDVLANQNKTQKKENKTLR